MADDGLTDQQRKWRASVFQSLESSTGRTLADWRAIVAICPETAPRARQRWLKAQHGLGQNYAMLVLHDAERAAGADPRDPATLATALWKHPAAAAIFDALRTAVTTLPDVVTGQRKGFTSWSRGFAFAAARPLRDGTLRLGLAVAPDADPRLAPPLRKGWSERLTAATTLATPDAIDDDLHALLRGAWARS